MGGFNMGGALGGATSGASMGSMFGPWGTAIGAGLGAISGGMESKGGGGGPIQGSSGTPPSDLGNAIQPPNSFAPPSLPSQLGTSANELPDAVRQHMLRQLTGQ